MRAALLGIILTLSPCAALAQGSDRLAPLPTGPALGTWLREFLEPGLDGVTAVTPSDNPDIFHAATGSPDLPSITLAAVEQMPALEPEAVADQLVRELRGGCDPWQVRGVLSRGALRAIAQTTTCPRTGASGLQLWVMVRRDPDRTQLVAMAAPMPQASALLARADRVMTAFGFAPPAQQRPGAQARPARSYEQLRADCVDDSDVERQIAGCDAVLANPGERNNYAIATNNRGHARERSGDLAAALQDYERAVALDPSYAMAHLSRGRILAMRGETAEAIAAFDRAIALDDSAWARTERGKAHAARRDWTRALADFEAALRTEPQDQEALAGREQARSALAQAPAPGQAQSADEQALRRSMFRTYALQLPFAPQATIAQATDCALEALRAAAPTVRTQIIEIDRVTDRRLAAFQRWAMAQTDPALAPVGACHRRLLDGGFGPTTGARVIATAAPNPTNVPACPADVAGFRGEELTCYCAPLQGGIAYGSRTYADLSTVCIAATHAGAFDFLTGGIVRAVFQPGCASYPSANGPTGPSGERGRTERSFYFPAVGPGACPR